MISLLVGAVVSLSVGKDASMIRADYLRCEYLVDPIGVDLKTPRLSWKPRAADPTVKGVRQSGYRILVASSTSLLSSSKADLWNSGKVASNTTFGIAYAGKPVLNGATAYWKVQLFDGKGSSSPWSKTARWTDGPTWNAKWIQRPSAVEDGTNGEANNGFHGLEVDREDGAQWVQIDLGKSMPIDAVKLFPARPYDFADTPGFLFPVRFIIQASDDPEFKAAKTIVDQSHVDYPNPGSEPVEFASHGSGRYVRLTVTKLKGRDARVFSYALAEMQVLSSGRNIALGRAVTADKSTESGAWSKDRLVDGETVSHGPKPLPALPATMLRREFTLASVPRHAILFATALGAYEVFINGARVGDQILAPEWTDYRDRVQYQGYDVAKLLKPGHNAIAVLLGDGWYAGRVGWYSRAMWGRVPAFLCQLDSDGTTLVTTDEAWRATDSGPIRESDIMDGETYDARRELAGWDRAGFDDSHWQPARILSATAPPLVAQPNEPIRIHARVKPIAITEPKAGVYVVDLGQNMVGWARIKLRGRSGETARIRYAEVLDDSGNVYTENLRSAPQTDSFVFADSKPVTFEPHFTYHGFRYVEITGVSAKPKMADITGMVFNSTSPEVGSFACSDPMLDRLWENILWTQRANLMSAPTDCPQRNERLGWMGDIQAFGQTAIYNMDLDGFFAKWTQDQRDAQSEEGLFAEFAPWPDKKGAAQGAPAWSDAGVFVPWEAYQNYGDLQLLRNHYDAAKRYVEFLHANNPDGLWLHRRGNDYNDWLNGDTLIEKGWPTTGGAVPPEVLATAFMARSTEIVSEMADALGNRPDAEKYSTWAKKCRGAFCRAYVAPDARIKGDTQAGYALALNFNLLPEFLRPLAAKHMADAVAKYSDHISTGIQTTHRLMLELTRWGYNDLAYKLMLNRTFPSWGYSIDNGATTIWERWDGYVKGRGFQNPGMNSFNHWALGAVGEWMMKVIGGLWPGEEPGWAHPTIRPIPGGGLTHAEATYDSVRGLFKSSWQIVDGRFSMSFTIPANTSATVVVPKQFATVRNQGAQIATANPGLKFVSLDQNGMTFEAESGSYALLIHQ